jgi:hypothetical protein
MESDSWKPNPFVSLAVYVLVPALVNAMFPATRAPQSKPLDRFAMMVETNRSSRFEAKLDWRRAHIPIGNRFRLQLGRLHPSQNAARVGGGGGAAAAAAAWTVVSKPERGTRQRVVALLLLLDVSFLFSA